MADTLTDAFASAGSASAGCGVLAGGESVAGAELATAGAAFQHVEGNVAHARDWITFKLVHDVSGSVATPCRVVEL